MTPTAYMVTGIDISAWQSPASDGSSMDGCEFVGIRACYGTAKDAAYDAHEANARAHRAVVIAYCFGRYGDGGHQAEALIAAAPRADLYALDLEADGSGPSMTGSQASAFLARANALTAKRVGLYHSESGFPSGLGEQFRWVAKWGSTPPSGPWAFWQWQGSPLDRDVFNGTLDQLRAMAGTAVPPPVPLPPPATLGRKPAASTGWIAVNGSFFRWFPGKRVSLTKRFSAWAHETRLAFGGGIRPGYTIDSGAYKGWLVFADDSIAWHPLPKGG